MIPVPVVGFFKAAWGFLRAIPWPVWAALLLALAVWRYGELRYRAGVVDCEAAQVEALARAYSQQQARTARRDATAAGIAEATRTQATEATIQTRTQTAAAVERVRYVTRTIEVPAGCPVGLPERVRDEGAAALARARAAAGELRAAGERP